MKVFITGSTGFVGQNLISYFKKDDVSLLDRNQLNNITIEELEAADTIIHLAGKAHDLKKTMQPDEYYQVNFELTKKLYDVFLKSNAKKFIFVSSVKAAADTLVGILNEEIIPSPQTHYGKSKLMAEQYIQRFPLPSGKSYYILRPCMIHGTGNKGNLNLLYKFVQKGIPYPFGAFNNQRSFLSIANLCYVMRELVKRNDIPSGIYNISDDEALSTNEVVRILAQSLKRPAKIWNLSKGLVRHVAGIGDILKLPLNSETLNKLTENYIVSNQKIKTVLASEFPVQSREGLLHTAESFKIS